LLKYAAAAVVSGLMIFGGYSLLKNKNNDKPTQTIVKNNAATPIPDEVSSVTDLKPDSAKELADISSTEKAINLAEEKEMMPHWKQANILMLSWNHRPSIK
jgi:hypothetical protein